MTPTQEEDVIPPMPRVPAIETLGVEAEATEQSALPPLKKRSELAAAGALFVVLLSAMTLAFGAITLVMF